VCVGGAMLLSLDEIVEEIDAYMQGSGLRWVGGKRFDSGASTRITVQSMLLTCDAAPPESRHIGAREAWTAVTPSGQREIDAQIWAVQERTFGQRGLTNVRTREDVRAFLAQHVR